MIAFTGLFICSVLCASYGDFFFVEVNAGEGPCLAGIELESFLEGNLQAREQLISCPFLAIDAGNFLDPSDPPIAIFLDHCGVLVLHFVFP